MKTNLYMHNYVEISVIYERKNKNVKTGMFKRCIYVSNQLMSKNSDKHKKIDIILT